MDLGTILGGGSLTIPELENQLDPVPDQTLGRQSFSGRSRILISESAHLIWALRIQFTEHSGLEASTGN